MSKVLSKGRKALLVIMTLGVVAVLGYLIIVNWSSILNAPLQFRLGWLLVSFLSYALFVGSGAYNWGSMLRTLGGGGSWGQHFRVYLLSSLLSRFPLPFGYVAGRFMLYGPETSKSLIGLTSTIEIILIILAGMTVGMIFGPGILQTVPAWIRIFILVLGISFVHPALIRRFLRLFKQKEPVELTYLHTMSWYGLFLFTWMAGGFSLYALITGLFPISLSGIIPAIGSWALASLMAMITVALPTGLALRELALSALLTDLVPVGLAVIFALLTRVVFTGFDLVLGGLAYILPKIIRRRQLHSGQVRR